MRGENVEVKGLLHHDLFDGRLTVSIGTPASMEHDTTLPYLGAATPHPPRLHALQCNAHCNQAVIR